MQLQRSKNEDFPAMDFSLVLVIGRIQVLSAEKVYAILCHKSMAANKTSDLERSASETLSGSKVGRARWTYSIWNH